MSLIIKLLGSALYVDPDDVVFRKNSCLRIIAAAHLLLFDTIRIVLRRGGRSETKKKEPLIMKTIICYRTWNVRVLRMGHSTGFSGVVSFFSRFLWTRNRLFMNSIIQHARVGSFRWLMHIISTRHILQKLHRQFCLSLYCSSISIIFALLNNF